MSKVSKTWDFTLNNFTDEDIDMLKRWTDDVGRMVVSKEVGEEGTPHLQGRVTFRRAYRLSGLKKLHGKMHWEPTKCKQDFLYVMKEGGEVIIDVKNGKQGERNDLKELVKMAKAGAGKRELWDEHPESMVRYHKGIYEAIEIYSMSENERFNGPFKWPAINDWGTSHILWGPSGVGKTQFAISHFKNPLIVSHADDLKRFDNTYDGIVFDDMDFKHWPRTSQIHLVDKDLTRSINCRFTNATIPANTRKIFTTNEFDGLIFDLSDNAIRRRVTVTEVR